MIHDVQELPPAPPATGTPAAARPRVVGLLGASFDTGNLGVSALASGTVAALREGMPDAGIVLLDYGRLPFGWTGDAESGPLRQVNLRFSKRIGQANHVVRLLLLALAIRLVPGRARRRKLAGRSAWLRTVAEPEMYVSLAGGDSFSDIYGLRRLVYMALPQVLVLLLERPLILLPQTYGPFRTRRARWLAGFILCRAGAIYSRDQEGLGVVTALLRGRGTVPQVAYDMGFGLAPGEPPAETAAQLRSARRAGPLVGLNVSGLLMMGGYAGNNQFGLAADYGSTIDALVELLAGKHRATVLLIPHVHAAGADSEGDLAACREIARRAGPRHGDRVRVLAGECDQHQTKHVIGACEFFIGARMHACIAALSQCVPAVGLAYSRKFAGVMATVGDGAVVVDLRTRGLDAVVAAVEAAWAARPAMRRQLLAGMPAIRRSALGLFRQPELQRFLPPAHP